MTTPDLTLSLRPTEARKTLQILLLCGSVLSAGGCQAPWQHATAFDVAAKDISFPVPGSTIKYSPGAPAVAGGVATTGTYNYYVVPCVLANGTTVQQGTADCAKSGGTPASVSQASTIGYIGLVIDDSEKKCDTFVNDMVLSELGVNTGLDLMNLASSAIGNIVGPAAVARGIGGLTTITSGARTAINQDLYAKMSANSLVTAIGNSYYKKMSDYISTLTSANAAQLDPYVEITKLRTIHAGCSLVAAQGVTTGALQGSGQPSLGTQAATTTTTVTINSLVAGVSSYAINAQTASNSVVLYTANYTLGAVHTPAALAQGLASSINSQTAMQSANITASAPSGATSLTISAPSSLGLIWVTPTASANISISSSQPATPGPASGTPASPAVPTDATGTMKATVPSSFSPP